MNFFTKLLYRLKRKSKNDECWYNNAHEQKRDIWTEAIDGEAFSGANWMDYSLTQQISQQ